GCWRRTARSRPPRTGTPSARRSRAARRSGPAESRPRLPCPFGTPVQTASARPCPPPLESSVAGRPFVRRHDSSIGEGGGMQNGRMARRHGQIAPVPDFRLELPEEGRRVAGRLLEQAAEVEFVDEAEFPCDL